MPERVSVRPIGEERHRLVAETGLVCWHYNSTPMADEIEGTPVWAFRFTAIEEIKMREYLIRLWMKELHLVRTKAVEWLCNDRICIPQDRLEMEWSGQMEEDTHKLGVDGT